MTGYLRICIAAVAALPAQVRAQDVVPATPRELRDFKLDPEKAPPVRGPLPTTEALPRPEIKPPAADVPAAVVPATRDPATKVSPTPVSAARAQKDSSTAKKPTAAQQQISSKPVVKAAAQDRVLAPVAAETNSDMQGMQAVPGQSDEASPAASQTASLPPAAELPWQWIIAALVLAMAAAGAIVVHRFRIPAHRKATLIDPVEEVDDGHQIAAPDIVPDRISFDAAVPATTTTPLQRPKLEISFTPEKASITMTNLTIKGRLHIVNTGDDNAAVMALNAAVISASNSQAEAIGRYFSGGMPPGKPLGAARSGEQIALEMDLMIPIADLQTFAAGDQRLLVPIILARLEYQWGEAEYTDEAQLSCLIGREATPPKPKMGALRLDLGPRNFASLGQRPVFG